MIDRVRKVNDQRVVIGCSENEEVNKVTQRLREANPTVSVERIENKDPLIVVKYILSFNKDEDILEAISIQNKQLYEGLTEEEFRITITGKKSAPPACGTSGVATAMGQSNNRRPLVH